MLAESLPADANEGIDLGADQDDLPVARARAGSLAAQSMQGGPRDPGMPCYRNPMSARVRSAILRAGGALLVALGVLHLAVTPEIVRLMGARHFGAPPFVLATGILSGACLALLAAAFWPAAGQR